MTVHNQIDNLSHWRRKSSKPTPIGHAHYNQPLYFQFALNESICARTHRHVFYSLMAMLTMAGNHVWLFVVCWPVDVVVRRLPSKDEVPLPTAM